MAAYWRWVQIRDRPDENQRWLIRVFFPEISYLEKYIKYSKHDWIENRNLRGDVIFKKKKVPISLYVFNMYIIWSSKCATFTKTYIYMRIRYIFHHLINWDEAIGSWWKTFKLEVLIRYLTWNFSIHPQFNTPKSNCLITSSTCSLVLQSLANHLVKVSLSRWISVNF